MRKLLLLVLGMIILTQTSTAQRIRNFSLQDINNNVRTYEEIKGEKLTIIDFWTTWCKPCRKSIPELNKIYEKFKDQGVSVVGLNCDDPRSVAKVAPMSKSMQIEYPVLLDIDSELFNYLNLAGFPTLILVDNTNKVRYIHEGFVAGDELEIIEQIEKQLSASSK